MLSRALCNSNSEWFSLGVCAASRRWRQVRPQQPWLVQEVETVDTHGCTALPRAAMRGHGQALL